MKTSKLNWYEEVTAFAFGMFFVNALIDLAGVPKVWWGWVFIVIFAVFGSLMGRWVWDRGHPALPPGAFTVPPDVTETQTEILAKALADNARVAAQRDELRRAALKLSLAALKNSDQHWAHCRVYRDGKRCDCGHTALVDEVEALNRLIDSQKE